MEEQRESQAVKEQSQWYVEDHLKITDPENQQEIVNKRG